MAADTELTEMRARAQSERLRLEGLEYAYDGSVASLVLRQRAIQFCGIALSLVVLTVQYLIGDRTNWLSVVLSQIQAILAVMLMVGVVWGLAFRWDWMLDRQQNISHALHRLVAEYQTAEAANTITQTKMAKWESARSEIESDRKNPLARISQRFIQRAYCHVAKKYPEMKMKCFECDRTWRSEYAHLRFWHYFPWIHRCNNCGVPLNERKFTRSSVQSA